MIQEYLFISNEKRTEIEEYRPEKVTVEIYEIDNSECWIATYSVQGEKEESANILSKVNKHIIDKYHPTVLINGCAAYYNKTLYPLINEFERKLRKLLYLKSALNKNDIASKNIQDLESKDLGEIFTLLFTDDQFVKNVRATVNSKTWQFSRQEILSTIERITENTTWDHLLGTESVPALRQQFLTVKDYRNDVMHAHDIEAKMFRDAKKVFEQVNNQLDSEIRKCRFVNDVLHNWESRKSLRGRAPVERTHGKMVVSAFTGSELLFEIIKGIEAVRGIEFFVVLAMGTLDLAIVPRRIRTNEFVTNAKLF